MKKNILVQTSVLALIFCIQMNAMQMTGNAAADHARIAKLPPAKKASAKAEFKTRYGVNYDAWQPGAPAEPTPTPTPSPKPTPAPGPTPAPSPKPALTKAPAHLRSQVEAVRDAAIQVAQEASKTLAASGIQNVAGTIVTELNKIL